MVTFNQSSQRQTLDYWCIQDEEIRVPIQSERVYSVHYTVFIWLARYR